MLLVFVSGLLLGVGLSIVLGLVLTKEKWHAEHAEHAIESTTPDKSQSDSRHQSDDRRQSHRHRKHHRPHHSHHHPKPEARITHKVLPYLYVGTAQAGYQLDQGLNPQSFELAINVAEELCDLRSRQDTCTMMHFPMKDAYERNFHTIIQEIVPIVQEAQLTKKKTLIFCQHGARRSVSTILAFLLTTRRFTSFDSALDLFEGQGWETRLSKVFENQVRQIETNIQLQDGKKGIQPEKLT